MFGLSKREKEEKQARQMAEVDAQRIYQKVNIIGRHYHMGLSKYEQIAYYTLCVAYGQRSNQYSDVEVKCLRDKLYFSNMTAQMNSAQRGMFGMQYDKIMGEHVEFLNQNGTRNVQERIKSIIETHNSIFPEYSKDMSQSELSYIEGVIKE